MDPVGADQHVGGHRVGALEPRLDPVAVVGQADEPVPDMHALRRKRPQKRREQVGAVHLVLREAERLDDRVAERRADERPAVLPAALVPGERPDAHRGQVVREAQAVEDARRVRADLDPGADLADRARLLVHLHVEAGAVERQRGRQAADPGADDRDGDVVLRHRARTVGRMLALPLDEAGGDRVTVTLPPDLSEQALSRALDEFAAAVGAGARADLRGGPARVPRSVLAPRLGRLRRPRPSCSRETVEEIQEIVRIANEHKVPLWTSSGMGTNNGYGGSGAAGARLGRSSACAG